MKIGLSPLQGQASFDDTLRECERAEAAGFDSVWLGEHHNNPILHPAPLIGLAAIASRTSRVKLGTGVLLLPLYHPMMVAEEGAMVDMISGGRLILGIGAGYAPEGAVTLDVLSLEVVEEPPSLSHELQEPAARVVILRMRPQMLGQIVDPSGEEGNLHLCRTCVGRRPTVLLDDLRLDFLREAHDHPPCRYPRNPRPA